MSDTHEPMQPSDFRERDRLEGNPSTIPALNTQALAALERVYAAASGGDVYPLLVELVRGLMEDAERLTLSRNAWKDSARITAARADVAEASLSALRERVAAKNAALKRIEPYADLDDLPIIKAALCDTGPSTDWPSIIRQILPYCRSILNDYPDKSPNSPLGILVREIDEKLAAFDTPASPCSAEATQGRPDAKVTE